MFAVETQQPHRIVLYETLATAQQALAQTALQWARNEVGERNVQNGLCSSRPLSEYPDGLCLHYTMVPGEKTILATRKHTVAGWLSTNIEYTLLNQFTMLPAEIGTTVSHHHQKPTILEQRGGTMTYEAVLDELRETLLTRRKFIA